MDGPDPLCHLAIDDFGAHTLPDVGTIVIATMVGILGIVGSAVLGYLNVQPPATARENNQSLEQVYHDFFLIFLKVARQWARAAWQRCQRTPYFSDDLGHALLNRFHLHRLGLAHQ